MCMVIADMQAARAWFNKPLIAKTVLNLGEFLWRAKRVFKQNLIGIPFINHMVKKGWQCKMCWIFFLAPHRKSTDFMILLSELCETGPMEPTARRGNGDELPHPRYYWCYRGLEPGTLWLRVQGSIRWATTVPLIFNGYGVNALLALVQRHAWWVADFFQIG